MSAISWWSPLSSSSHSAFSAAAVRLRGWRFRGCSVSKTLISAYSVNSAPMAVPELSSSSSPSRTPSTTASPATVVVKAPKPKPKPQPWLIVGLGNPGKKYNGTRHNVGFEMVDAIAEAEGIPISSVSFKALFGKDTLANIGLMTKRCTEAPKPMAYLKVK